MRGGGKVRARRISASVDRKPPTPAQFDAGSLAGGSCRDSDASFCSSVPSIGRFSAAHSVILTDRKSQAAALHSINAYLASLSAPVSLKPPLPSGRDIEEAFRFIALRLDWPLGTLKNDLPALLSALGCPVKLSGSVLNPPGAAPHTWPPLLSALHWLAQIAMYADQPPPPRPHNELLSYLTRSYSLFISGEDDAVADLDAEYLRKTEEQVGYTVSEVGELEKEVARLEEKLRALTSGPSPRQALEEEQALLTKDAGKFCLVLESNRAKAAALEKEMKDREGELAAKEAESLRIRSENEELKKRIDGQAVSSRDAERMKKEAQAVENEIFESENRTAELEEKALELDRLISCKFKELEALADQCNQAIRKLKLATNFHYVLNNEGSSPAEVIGADYKPKLKPALNAYSADLKNSSVTKLEESIALRKQIEQKSKMLEEKNRYLATLETKIEASETQLELLKKEVEDHEAKCTAEVGKLREELRTREQQLDMLAREAQWFLQESEQKLQAARWQTDEEIQLCANELFALIEMVSEYKEYVESVVLGVKEELSEAIDAAVQVYKASVMAKLAVADALGQCGSKRARPSSPVGMA